MIFPHFTENLSEQETPQNEEIFWIGGFKFKGAAELYNGPVLMWSFCTLNWIQMF